MDLITAPVEVGVVELQGEDVRRFANNMFTNNVRDLPEGAVQRTAMVSDRGRVQGLLDLCCAGEERLIAILEGVESDAFIERYDAFVFVEDVEFVDRTAALRAQTVQGPGAADALAAAGLPVPEPGHFIEADGALVFWRDRTGLGGFDLLLPPGRDGVAGAADSEALERLRVRAGKPRYPHDFGDKSLPHEMRMKPDFLHFQKGCYIGQETIHRVEVQGKVRKRLMGLRLSEAVEAGAELFVGEKKVGVLTSPVVDGDEVLALAVLRPPATEPGAQVVAVEGERQIRATVSDLPFDG